MSTVTLFKPVQEDIREVEKLMRAQADGHHPDLLAALDHLLSSGGKRIRPTMGLLISKMLGGDHDQMIMLAAAVELLHTATLVHDDLIDGSLLRRGNPTLNARWSPAATVLTGDFIFAKAARLAAEINCLPLMRRFAETLAVIVDGELTQLFSARGLINHKNYLQRIYAKTASLFEMSARAAAMISPVDDEIVEAMRSFGYSIGMAFQIVDDILDFTGEQASVGKPVGSDLLQGLVTLPALYYIENHPEDTDIIALLESEYEVEREEKERLIQAIRGSEAVAKSFKEAREFIESSIAELANVPVGVEKQSLIDLAHYVVDRKT